MYLVRLIYTSSVSEDFESSDVESILACAREKNKKNHVSGVLCFSSKHFLQCLEGSRAEVNRTYHEILKDPRHKNVVILDYKEIAVREFGEWSMGYIPASSISFEMNMRFSGSPEFTPYEMSGESAHQMLVGVGQSVPLIS